MAKIAIGTNLHLVNRPKIGVQLLYHTFEHQRRKGDVERSQVRFEARETIT